MTREIFTTTTSSVLSMGGHGMVLREAKKLYLQKWYSMFSRGKFGTWQTLHMHLKNGNHPRNTCNILQATKPFRSPTTSYMFKPDKQKYAYMSALVSLVLHNLITNIKKKNHVSTTSIMLPLSLFKIKVVSYHTCFNNTNKHLALHPKSSQWILTWPVFNTNEINTQIRMRTNRLAGKYNQKIENLQCSITSSSALPHNHFP